MNNVNQKIGWFKENFSWIKWVLGIVWSVFLVIGSSYVAYQKMKWDIDDIKRDMESANIVELKANVEAIKSTNDQINRQLNIIIQRLLND